MLNPPNSLFNARKGPFYDPWEAGDVDIRQRTIRKRLLEYVQFARKNVSFYSDRLSSFDPKAEHPLLSVPLLKSADLRKYLPPAGHDLIAPLKEPYTVFQSGGTTGLPKSTLFSHAELDQLDLPNARGFFALGLTPEDRVGNVFAVGSLYMTFVHINRMLQQYGCMNFPFSNHTANDFVHTVTKLFKINCFTGISSVILGCLRSMANIGLEGIQIDKIFYGGEHFYEADKIELQKKFGVKIVAAPGYGTVETWYIGYQCQHCPTGVFHAHDDQTYIEIIDLESGKPCAPDVIGMLVATPMPRRLTPIVRYLVGDRAKWLKDGCPCGRTTPLFKLLGRGDDVLRIGFDSIDYNSVQDVAAQDGRISGTIQIEKQRREGRDLLIVRAEATCQAEERETIQTEIARKIETARPSLRDEIAKGIVWPVQVEIVPPGTLPRNAKTGKLIRVVDLIKD